MKNITQPPLIIAGIGEQQLYAAAILLCQWADAELATAAAKGLAAVLNNIAVKNQNRAIYIVGAPGTATPDITQKAVLAIIGKQNHPCWIGFESQRAPAGTAWKEELVVPATETMAETALRIAAPPRRKDLMLQLCSVARKIKDGAELNSTEEELAIVAKSALWAATDLHNFDAYRQGIFRLTGIRQPPGRHPFDSFINHYTMWGADRPSTNKSDAAKKMYKTARMLGQEGECRVLITGETGTGKETIARLIHASSPRMDKPFIPFNCAELSPQLLEGKLFGYMKGAFTGAEKTYKGAFECANGGILFLDEVAELSPAAQAGLLRVLQEGRFMPLGSEKEVEVDIRILAATNQPLKAMMKAGTFREDLYYRLNAVILHLPPLQERKEDIEAITWNYWKRRPTPEQLQVLCSYSWPGNVRELLSILDRARIFKKEDHLSDVMPIEESADDGTADETLESAIRAHVRKIHERYSQNSTRAAKALGISINTLKKYLYGGLA